MIRKTSQISNGVKKTTKKKTVTKRKTTTKKEEVPEPKKERYFEAVGRRKTAMARVRLFPQRGKPTVHTQEFLVNNKPHNIYFPGLELQQIVVSPLEKTDCLDEFKVMARVGGGGFHAQAEALRHGISRALVLFNPDFRKKLKKTGFLTRDARMRERKKFGLKRARRAPQWQKR